MTKSTRLLPLKRYCRLKTNIDSIMFCHLIAKELFDNTQSKDLIFDLYNKGEGPHLMEVCAEILREACDPYYRLKVEENRKRW